MSGKLSKIPEDFRFDKIFVIKHMLMTTFLIVGLMKAEKSMEPAILGLVHVFVSQVGPG